MIIDNWQVNAYRFCFNIEFIKQLQQENITRIKNGAINITYYTYPIDLVDHILLI